MGKNYTIRITVEIIDQSGLHLGHGHRDIEDVPVSQMRLLGYLSYHSDFVKAWWIAKNEFDGKAKLAEIEAGGQEPLPFENNCTLPRYGEHEHCMRCGQCVPHGTDCPKCGDLEAKGTQEPDIRSQMSQDPISAHHADCQCARCSQGDGAVLWLYHPGDY